MGKNSLESLGIENKGLVSLLIVVGNAYLNYHIQVRSHRDSENSFIPLF